MLQTLGIHSNVIGNASLTDGHAWLTMHFPNGNSTSVGLWTSTLGESRRLVKDPTGFMLGETYDVEFGWEIAKHYQARASRFYRLSPDQAKFSTKVLGAYTSWRYSNTCATWATSVVHQLTGEEIASSELLGITNTPRALGNALVQLERRNPTSLQSPKLVLGNPLLRASRAGSSQ